MSSEKPCEPATIEEATNCSEKTEWMQAMEKEMKSLKQNNVWELVELPSGRKTVGSKWVYKVKTGVDGLQSKIGCPRVHTKVWDRL